MNEDLTGRDRPRTLVVQADARTRTRRIVVAITTVVAVTAVGYLVWALRPIILPFIVGTLTAYLCFPLLRFFFSIGIPRPAGILLLFGAFFLAIMVIANQVGSILPDEREWLVLRTRFQYKLNERYKSFMNLEGPGQTGNIIYKYFGNDLNRLMDNVNSALRLNREEHRLFMRYRAGYQNKPRIKDLYYGYFLKNTESQMSKGEIKDGVTEKEGKEAAVEPEEVSNITTVIEAVKLWIITPLVFLFLLIDDGQIKRFFVGLVPNRYFEVSLVVFDKVNRAIGNYLRGVLIECLLVGISYLTLLSVIGFEIKFALMIGLIAGIANAVPLIGPAIALAAGSAYALIAEKADSVLPFITPDNLIIAVAACVLLVMVLDSTLFQPFVVGGAVQVHPLVVFVGVIGGSILFGFAGLILAIPTIVVVKEFVSTLFRELRDYYII
jgi:predicted PurR-regulated permease PerM